MKFIRKLETPCVPYEGSKDEQGYGRQWYQGRTHMAHRVVWMMNFGKIPPGLQVLHQCDNASCVNIDHLILGTLRNNLRDKQIKGRTAKGVKNGTSKLNPEKVIDIRQRLSKSESMLSIARLYGMNYATIRSIRDGETWLSVSGETPPAPEPAPENCPVKVGQIWRENDRRFERRLEVLAVTRDYAIVRSTDGGRKTKASLTRFCGKTSGYSLTNEPPPPNQTSPEERKKRGRLKSSPVP